MTTATTTYRSGDLLSPRSIMIWRIAQTLVWIAGIAIFLSLIFFPSIGLLVFWNILIPVAPALLVVATGLWRNVCPLATTTLLPRHFNLSAKKKMPASVQVWLQLIAIIILYTVVPLRHAIFNTNGIATAILLFGAAITGLAMGFFYDWKSGWCSSLCPIHPVEKLYGGNTVMSFPNAHCGSCVNCSVPCPDSTPDVHPAIATKTSIHQLNGLLTIGVLPGFIWGWFHVSDNYTSVNWQKIIEAYTLPVTCGAGTLLLYIILKNLTKNKYDRLLINIFAAAAVSCYYWYRIPELFGFGTNAEDGLLINLKNILPQWIITAITMATTVFFFVWLTVRKLSKKSWVLRPRFAEKHQAIEG
jgi:hypothetical protein